VWSSMLFIPSCPRFQANFYPELGVYSSNDREILDSHVNQIQSAGIDVLVHTYVCYFSARIKHTL
jgi:hypothetical protein